LTDGDNPRCELIAVIVSVSTKVSLLLFLTLHLLCAEHVPSSKIAKMATGIDPDMLVKFKGRRILTAAYA
jgi:hypothetical protein